MKRAIFTVAATVLALFPRVGAASESFTLTIPQRFDATQEIGEVRIVLGLNAAPAGAQLVVGGSATIALGATQTVAGDSIAFSSGPGNAVMIRYRPLSNFGADFCAGAGATEKNIALRFSGAQDVVEYRLSSFVVGAPNAECSDVSRRVADMAATIVPAADGVAPALSATNRGRLPLDVILVLDKSGSMADPPPDAGPNFPTSKAAILKSAAKAFVAQWRQIDAPTGSGDWSEDRIGVVLFDSTATPQSLAGGVPPANFFVKRGSSAAPGPWDAVTGAIDGLTPGASTSIGAGINAAHQQWKNDPAHDLTCIVVTDGMQNTAPLITAAPSGFLSLTPVAGLAAELRQRFIPIQTIGFGTPAAVDENLLRNISFETAGRSYISVNATTMFDAFGMTLVSSLKGNTASIATRQSASLAGLGPTAAKPVIVDKSARRVVFSLQWTPPLRNALELEVFRPGSTKRATPTRGEHLPQASLQTFDLRPSDVGTWSVRVRGKLLDQKAPIPYTLNVFFLERHLDYRLTLDPPHPGVGQEMHLRAELSYDGKPLTHLPAGAVRVRVLRPRKTLEAVLRDVKVVKQRPETHGDPLSATERALASLTPAQLAQLLPSDAETVTLKEEKRGFYGVTIDKALLGGSYAFEVVLDWTDSRTGRVHREERLEQLVTARP
ncbi:MAG: VWA domain-containing protein [Acidobacteria bacterium]|nr:VWA domain-containing protein [Acidobacteriota bacterium]MBV9476300.1 VWA domain-containing protein [Acidobacteriota bacterium]